MRNSILPTGTHKKRADEYDEYGDLCPRKVVTVVSQELAGQPVWLNQETSGSLKDAFQQNKMETTS